MRYTRKWQAYWIGLILAIGSPVLLWAEDRRYTLLVPDMHCAVCVPAVQKALKQVEGVREVQVSLEEKKAVVVADERVPVDTLVRAVAQAGYSARPAE